jgi:hypothetical protein
MPKYEATPEQRRLHALSVYRRKKTYRRTAEELGVSPKRAHELVRAGLKIEIQQAKEKEEGDTTNER